MTVRGIASAPVSFGVYGSVDQLAVSPHDLLDSAVEAGYRGMELGPPGFFGTADETATAFSDRGLTAVGAYVPIHFSADDAILERDLANMRHTLHELARASSRPGLAILADEGSAELLSHPARDWDDHRLALDEAGWRRLAAGVARALAMAEHFGVPTSFHPHISTYVESPWEIDRLLQSTAVELTLDSGHFWLAGTDPAEALVRYGSRVNHVHLKDVRRSVLHAAKTQGRTDFDAWWGDVATPLGAGDVDLEGFLAALLAGGYEGWLVVEQDRLPLGADPIGPVTAEQTQNRLWVEGTLARLGAPLAQGPRTPAAGVSDS